MVFFRVGWLENLFRGSLVFVVGVYILGVGVFLWRFVLGFLVFR